MEDLRSGRVGELADIDTFSMASGLLCHRFGVWEARPDGWRVRCIDNYFANRVNSFAVLPGRVYHDNLDHLLSAMVWLARKFPGSLSDLHTLKTDFKAAFKTLGVSAGKRWLHNG